MSSVILKYELETTAFILPSLLSHVSFDKIIDSSGAKNVF